MPNIRIYGVFQSSVVKNGYEYLIAVVARDDYPLKEGPRPRPVDLVFVPNSSKHVINLYHVYFSIALRSL